jgi:hypothetical protein
MNSQDKRFSKRSPSRHIVYRTLPVSSIGV